MSTQRDRSNETTRGKEVAFLSLICYLINLRKSVVPSAHADESKELDVNLYSHILRMMSDLSILCHSDTIREKAEEAHQQTLVQVGTGISRR